jgi:hypothetical protein
MNDIFHPGVMCTRCGQQQRGSASIDGLPFCHPDDPELPDCYTLTSWDIASIPKSIITTLFVKNT